MSNLKDNTLDEAGGNITLYHTAYLKIPFPDVHYGRKNADFGQGFYMTDDPEFASRWAFERKGETVYINKYTLDMNGLRVKRFDREKEWFEYIFKNRRSPDDKINADVVIGPIANDTIYDTMGIISSGFLTDDQALELLMLGPVYYQIALRTKRAAEHLNWVTADVLLPEDIREYRRISKSEEEEYQKLIAAAMSKWE